MLQADKFNIMKIYNIALKQERSMDTMKNSYDKFNIIFWCFSDFSHYFISNYFSYLITMKCFFF